jgi:hypothetical protein
MRSFRFLIVFALAVAAFPILAQSTDPALTAAINARDKASMERDASGLAKYTADDYIAVNPQGVLNNKQQRLDGLKTPPAPNAQPPVAQRTEAVHMYGANAAVARTKGVGNRNVSVWIRDSKGWQLHAIHVVPDAFVPQQPATPALKAPEPSPLKPPAGVTGDRAAVFAAFKQIQDSVFNGDHATYERLTAPEHFRLLPGMMRYGTETYGAVGNEPRKHPKYSDITVNVWDQLGVVRWHEVNGNGVAQWLTRVFAKKATTWQQVATASSLAAKAGS